MTGRTILNYQLIEQIGDGGMGVVWKAVDTRLEREVALKFLPETATTDPSRRERFFREAKAASALNHPNIVTIYEINSDTGELFIAMELIRGRSLAEILKARKHLPPTLVADYALQLCEGLGAAHRAGIVHRDIKPSNVMVTHEGLVKILDFGLAKLWAPEPENAAAPGGSTLSVVGTVVGTPSYMSPEQAVGGNVGPQSDVFSVGTVLYEMLSGHRPFKGTSNSEIMRALIATDPAPLPSVAADVPEPLARIAHKCLSKKAEDRYADGREIAAGLRTGDYGTGAARLYDQTTITMTTQAPAPEVFWKRRGLLAGVAAGVLAVALGGWYLWRSDATGGVPSDEALKVAQAYLQRYDKKGNVDKAIATLEPVLGPAGSGPALRPVLAEAYVRKYTETADKQWVEKATEVARQAVDANDDLAAAHAALGMALAASGQSVEAANQFERARALNPRSGPAHLGLAKLRTGQEAEQLYQKAIEYSPGEWDPLSALARFYYNEARYDDSVVTWRRSLELAPDNVLVMVYLAAPLLAKGQYEEVADTVQEALTRDQESAPAWANLGTARYFQRLYSQAVESYEKAVKYAPNNYLYWGNLGDSYRWADGLRDKAGVAYRTAIGLVQNRLATTPGDVVLRSRLAEYLAKSGDAAGALAELARMDKARLIEKGMLFKVAMIYELAHDRDKALDALNAAIDAGYSRDLIDNEPELRDLREDGHYKRMARPATAKGKSVTKQN